MQTTGTQKREIDLIKLIRLQLTVSGHHARVTCLVVVAFFSSHRNFMKISFIGHVFAFCSPAKLFSFHHLMEQEQKRIKTFLIQWQQEDKSTATVASTAIIGRCVLHS